MPRKAPAVRPSGFDWHLRDWMQVLRVSQADLMRATGWSKATTNDIYNGKTGFYRQIVGEAAAALNIAPYELLLSPETAMSIRRLHENAIRIAADETIPYRPPPRAPRTGTDG